METCVSAAVAVSISAFVDLLTYGRVVLCASKIHSIVNDAAEGHARKAPDLNALPEFKELVVDGTGIGGEQSQYEVKPEIISAHHSVNHNAIEEFILDRLYRDAEDHGRVRTNKNPRCPQFLFDIRLPRGRNDLVVLDHYDQFYGEWVLYNSGGDHPGSD